MIPQSRRVFPSLKKFAKSHPPLLVPSTQSNFLQDYLCIHKDNFALTFPTYYLLKFDKVPSFVFSLTISREREKERGRVRKRESSGKGNIRF